MTGLLGLGRVGEVAAADQRVGQRCQKSTDCCAGARCQGRRCRCRPGLTACNRRCRNVRTDPKHCGVCGTVCPSGACQHGACRCDSFTDCADGCQCNAVNVDDGGNTFVCTEPGSPCDGPRCTSDNDCPLGSVCQLACEQAPPIGVATCTVPCGA